jgi:hypothetical protein
MEKFAVNYNHLQSDLAERPKFYRLADVEHRLTKVAYDIVRFTDGDDISSLWQVQETQDGEVIIAQYDDTINFSPVSKTASASTDWKVLSDNSNEHINIFYKSSPVTKLSLASLGIPSAEADVVCRYLPEKLASNKVLASKLLLEISPESRKELLTKHPELND